METALYILHVLVCIAMLPIILLQSGKGGGVSAVFGGGGGGSVMGSRGASNFLTRMTTGAAVIFMCTSLALSYLSSRTGSVVGEGPAPTSAGEPAGSEAASPELPGPSEPPLDSQPQTSVEDPPATQEAPPERVPPVESTPEGAAEDALEVDPAETSAEEASPVVPPTPSGMPEGESGSPAEPKASGSEIPEATSDAPASSPPESSSPAASNPSSDLTDE